MSSSQLMRPLAPHGSRFGSTMLPIVEEACRGNSVALEDLARRYWYPTYAYLRRVGNPRERAEDLVQEFLSRFLAPERLSAYRPSMGRFRTFLLAGLRHFARDRWRLEQTQMRGGGIPHASLDATDDDGNRLVEAIDDADAVRAFERKWARAVLAEARARLRAEWVRIGKADLFEALEATLDGEKTEAGYEALAQRLGTSVAMIKKHAANLRAAERHGPRPGHRVT